MSNTYIYPLTTTLNRIWACDPCEEGKAHALKAAGKAAPDDEPITYQQIIESAGLDDALWCCRAEPQYQKEWRLFAVWCARQVQYQMKDQRSLEALDVAERHARGEATDAQLDAACAAAREAAREAAMEAASAAAWAASAAAMEAASAAARAASAAVWAASAAAREAWAAAKAAARDVQQTAFIQLVATGTLPELQRQEVE